MQTKDQLKSQEKNIFWHKSDKSDADYALDKLLDAIRSIENHYIVINYNENVPDNELQPERSFAYQLYLKWSLLLDHKPEEVISSHKLTLSGEITKHFKDDKGILSPDLVLHGGQNDTQHQLIACEIKRKLNNSKDGKGAVLQDFIKLYHYLNLKRHVINGDSDDAKYDKAVFIALNTDKEKLTYYIKMLFENFSAIEIKQKYLNGSSIEKLKSDILETSDNIICIYVNPSSGKPYETPETGYILLSELIDSSHCHT